MPLSADLRQLVVVLVLLIPAVAMVVGRRLPSTGPVRSDVSLWLRMLAAALAVTALRYASFVPAPYSTIWTFGHAMAVAPGIPIFDQWGNMARRIQLVYDDPTLNALIGAAGTRFRCGAEGVAARGPLYGDAAVPGQTNASPYGETYFVDVMTGRAELIDTPTMCRNAARSFPRSPYVLLE